MGLGSARNERIQVQSLGNCTLMKEELDLLKSDDVCELEDDLLWIAAKL